MVTLEIYLQEDKTNIRIRDYKNCKMYFKTIISENKHETMDKVIMIAREYCVDKILLDIIGWSGFAFVVLESKTTINDLWYGKILNFDCIKID